VLTLNGTAPPARIALRSATQAAAPPGALAALDAGGPVVRGVAIRF
jgi:hypothetical protein